MKLFTVLALFASLLLASVDVNSADKEALMSLHGIGEAKAKAIILHREMKCISSLEELQSVRGIGDAIIAKNKDAISFGTCKK